MYYVYILRNSQNKLYVGQTNNPLARGKRHGYGLASQYTSQGNHDFKLVFTEEFATRAEAMTREKQLKKWSRAKKEALISGDLQLLKRL